MNAVFFRLNGAFFRRSNISQGVNLMSGRFTELGIVFGKLPCVNRSVISANYQ